MLTLADPPGRHADRKPMVPALLDGAALQTVGLWLPLIATLYSAVMAMGIAQGFPGSYQLVVIVELGLLGAALAAIVASGIRPTDWTPILFLYGLVILAVVLSMINNRPMIEVLRATFLIGVFALVGQRMTLRTLDRLFIIVSIAVLAVLLLEIFAQISYIWLFQPQRFFSATRGIEASEYNSSGLFNTAAGFEGRFNFGLFDVPRTSSVFLEQVSNANFACVLALYVSARWNALGWLQRGLCMGTVAMILVSTNGRFASLLILAMILGWFVFPLLGRVMLPLVSVAIAAIAFTIILTYPYVEGDNLIGRINFVGQQFKDADLAFYFGARAAEALRQRDSGYSYIIGSTTIFGAIALWAFINFYPRANDAASRRLAFGVVGYMLGQLVISSTSLFSIKTSALLWVMVGCIRMQPPVNASSRAPAMQGMGI